MNTAQQLEAIIQNAFPCQPTHPYLKSKGLTGAPCNVYVDLTEINNIQCHGAIVIPIYDIGGKIVNVQFIANDTDGKFIEVFVPDALLSNCFARIGKLTNTILVATDWASAMSAHLATGHAAAVAIRDENLLAVCEALAARYPDRAMIVCGYSDDLDNETPGRSMPAAAAKKTGALLAIPNNSGTNLNNGATFNALHLTAGVDAVRTCIEAAALPTETESNVPTTVEHEVERLAALSQIEYEQQRTKSAKKFSLRASFLDKLVLEAREKLNTMALIPEGLKLEPHPEPVDGPQLFQMLVSTVRRFTVLSPSGAVAVALWIIMTYFIGIVGVAPILGLVSPVKRCGKTTLLSLLDRLALRTISTANITAAALFRCIQEFRPTLLIDEADTFIHRSDELNGIINSGHARSTAYVYRVVDGQAQQFNTFCAKAIAVIGKLPETMFDRTIIVPLRRKRANEEVEPLRHASNAEFLLLKAQIHRWASDNAAQIATTRPVLNGVPNDRAVDNWEPLLAIATCLGPECAATATDAAIELSAAHAETKSLSEELLADIREAFQTEHAVRLTSSRLIEIISADDEKPWATYDHGRRITSRQLSGLLAIFGICSKNLRISPTAVVKGYEKSAFADSFARYLGVPSA